MSLPVPNLDDRDFQELVDQAKRHVQEACPEWTDHNVSDPGVVLIELFAKMTDEVIYRLNQVPDHLYRHFLSLIGVTAHPPRAASTGVTFWLSAAQPATVVVPHATQVATKRTRERPAVGFAVLDDFEIVPCSAASVGVAGAGGEVADRSGQAPSGTAFAAFSEPPGPDDALHVDLSASVPGCVVAIELDCDDAYGHGADPRYPPFVWEVSGGGAWRPIEFEDRTEALNRKGEVVVHIPGDRREEAPTRLRCRVVEGKMPPYRESPRLSGVRARTVGGTAQAIHGDIVEREPLGASTGQPSQRFTVQRPPIVGRSDVVVESRYGDEVIEYELVDNFADSQPESKHFTLDVTAGQVVFGPAIRDGDEQGDTMREGRPRQHGMIPPAGARLLIKSYMTGGGPEGNVARGELRVLKTTIPFVARVENRRGARGGAPAETVEEACARGPIELRRRERAVTAEDYEHFAIDAADGIARARCMPPPADEPTSPARVLVVPRFSGETTAPPTIDDLIVTHEAKVAAERDLRGRCVMGARFVVMDARYQAIRIDALVRVLPGREEKEVVKRCQDDLYRYFHPTRGGDEGRGWPFGRAVYDGMAYLVLQRVEGVDIVQDLRLYPMELDSDRTGDSQQRIDLPPDTVIVSREHHVAAVAGEDAA